MRGNKLGAFLALLALLVALVPAEAQFTRRVGRPASYRVGLITPITATTAVPGSVPVDVSAVGVAPALHYHLPTAAVSTSPLTSHSRSWSVITSVPDRRGLADASNSAGTGPVLLTDGLGRRFARFSESATTGTYKSGPNGPNLLQIGSAFSANTRSVTVFAVVRQHKANGTDYFSLGVAGSSPPNTVGSTLRTAVVSSSAPLLGGAGGAAAITSVDTANVARMVPGSQLQVIGVASRSATLASGGGQRFYLNTDTAQTERSGSSVIAGTGATIGSYAYAPSAAGAWFDLYELLVFNGDLTNTQADAIALALTTSWSIAPITSQIVLEGDSIIDGITNSGLAATSDLGVPSGESLGMLLSEPGSPLAYPAGWRVLNRGSSGATASVVTTRRDATNGVASLLLPGRNVVALLLGRNLLGAEAKTGAQAYADMVSLWSTTSTGYLQRGWEGVQMTTLGMSSSLQAENDNLRALLRAPAFLSDTQSGSGQAFAGKLGVRDLALIRAGGIQRFNTTAQVAGTEYMQGDSTHPNRALGTPLMVSGGETPQYGYRSILP